MTTIDQEKNVIIKSNNKNTKWRNQNRYKNQQTHRPPLYNNLFRQNSHGLNKTQENIYVKQLSVEQESTGIEENTIENDNDSKNWEQGTAETDQPQS